MYNETIICILDVYCFIFACQQWVCVIWIGSKSPYQQPTLIATS